METRTAGAPSASGPVLPGRAHRAVDGAVATILILNAVPAGLAAVVNGVTGDVRGGRVAALALAGYAVLAVWAGLGFARGDVTLWHVLGAAAVITPIDAMDAWLIRDSPVWDWSPWAVLLLLWALVSWRRFRPRTVRSGARTDDADA